MQVPFVCMWLMIVLAGTKRLPGVGTVLAHSLRRWIGVVPRWVDVYLVLFISLVLIWCRAGVVGGGPALNRHWACFSCLLGDQMTKNIDCELSCYREYNITSFFQFLSTNKIITT